MKKLFVLIGTKGSWDAHVRFIVGIYDSLELAEQEKTKILEELTLISQKYTYEEADKLEREYMAAMMASPPEQDDEDVIHSPEVTEFTKWPFRHECYSYNLDEFEITEYSLNQRNHIIE